MVIEVKTENFEEEVLKNNIPVIVDFYADWCGPCKMMAPVFDELSAEFAKRLKFVRVNTQIEPLLAAEQGVMSIPILKIFKDGIVVDEILGFMPKERLKERIEIILKRLE